MTWRLEGVVTVKKRRLLRMKPLRKLAEGEITRWRWKHPFLRTLKGREWQLDFSGMVPLKQPVHRE